MPPTGICTNNDFGTAGVSYGGAVRRPALAEPSDLVNASGLSCDQQADVSWQEQHGRSYSQR
eukprot:148689-Pleurochrysis_carterae.AAC.1